MKTEQKYNLKTSSPIEYIILSSCKHSCLVFHLNELSLVKVKWTPNTEEKKVSQKNSQYNFLKVEIGNGNENHCSQILALGISNWVNISEWRHYEWRRCGCTPSSTSEVNFLKYSLDILFFHKSLYLGKPKVKHELRSSSYFFCFISVTLNKNGGTYVILKTEIL